MNARKLTVFGMFILCLQVSAWADWPMVAANPQRTSWVAEEVQGSLGCEWYRQFEPYINYKTHVIAADNQLFISTAKGLYSINPLTGQTNWVYATEFSLGNSPTYSNGTLYVGSYDRKMHAVNATSGSAVWTFEAFAGFETNPLVINGRVYAGCRDGIFYCLSASTGQMIWSFQTGGPIRYSPAYQNGMIYFPANDAYCYALDAASGALVWKSAKLVGAGFHSYWPVIYQDKIILRAAYSYRGSRPGSGSLYFQQCFTSCELRDLYPDYQTDPRGTLVGPAGTEPGDWVAGTPTVDCSRITQYFEQKPQRRTYIILNLADGSEYTFDYDSDNSPEYAPFLYTGTHSGSPYPPVIGADGVLYQQANFKSDPWIAGGELAGWKFGTPFISNPWGGWIATDEPLACAAGGNLIYTGLCCDRTAGSSDITMGAAGGSYFSYSLPSICPGYNSMYFNGTNGPEVYGSSNGTYSTHGTQNPPIPYNGKVYMIRGNAVMAFDSSGGAATEVTPMVQTVPVQDSLSPLGQAQITQLLEDEIQKMLDAGHLRPGYLSTSFFDFHSKSYTDRGVDYWHNPAETIRVLLGALPHVSGSLQTQLSSYIQNEFSSYPPYQVVTIGWQDGAQREAYITPSEVQADMATLPASSSPAYEGFSGWTFPPQNFYALAKYAAQFGGAASILDQCRNKLNATPDDQYLSDYPYVHNAFIAGHIGYLELQALAGEQESTSVQNELNRLLGLRVSHFSKDTPFLEHQNTGYRRTMNISRNFIHMVPELADYLRQHALAAVAEAINEYEEVSPGWFVTRYDGTYCEGSLQQPFDFHAILQAKAMVLRESAQDLERYIDVPSVAVGDLYFIDNLVAALNAGSSGNQPPSVNAGSDQQMTWPENSAMLDAAVSDDGLPDPPGVVTQTWSKQSGTGTVSFADENAVDTSVTFSGPGTYVLRLTVDDSELTWYDDVSVIIYDAPVSNLVSHWKLDEGSGSTAYDETDNNNDGVVSGAVWGVGYLDGGLHFYGDPDIVDIPDAASLRVQEMTIAAWIKPDTSLGSMSHSYPAVVTKQDWSNNCGFLLGVLAADTDQLGFRLMTGSSTGDRKEVTYSEPDSGQWFHVAATYDGSTMRIYRNGEIRASSELGAVIINHNSYGLKLGRNFEGGVDDVRIYDRALSQTELEDVMGASEPNEPNEPPTGDITEGLDAYYKLDETSGSQAADDSSNSNDGTVTGAVWAPGKVNNALHFYGDDDIVDIADHSSLRLQEMTLAAWIYPDAMLGSMSHNYPSIISKQDWANNAGYVLGVLAADTNQIGFRLLTGSSTADRREVGFLEDGSDQWIHIAAVYDGDYMKLYKNGTEAASLQIGSISINHNGTGVNIGRKFEGLIDEARIYGRALSEDEINMLISYTDPQNEAPTVDAGVDQQITLPTDSVSLDATVTDDGLPDPPAAVSITWTKQSGPGMVTFTDENAVDTGATFSAEGVYVLRLTATDGDLSDANELTVTVEPEPSGPSNLLSNPGFEAQMTGWQNILQTGSAVSTAQAHGGSYVLELTADAVRVVGQSVPCTAGQDYTGSGWLKIDDPDVTRCQLRLEWLDSLGARISLQNIIDTGGVQDWTYYEQTFTAPSGAVDVSFQAVVFTSSDGSGYVWFDDCGLQ